MIHVEILGGLGNQLFIYAFARALQLETGEGLRMYDIHTATTREAEITVSRLVPETADVTFVGIVSNRAFWQQIPVRSLLYRVVRRLCVMLHGKATSDEVDRLMLPLAARLGIYYLSGGYAPVQRSRLFRDIYCFGYFQSPRFWGSHAEAIRRELCRPDLISETNRDFLRTIQEKNAVCLHIRMGDYVSDPGIRARFYVCGREYYQAAVRQAAAEISQPVFVVFSNDYEAVRQTVSFPEGSEVLFAPEGSSAIDDLQLMAQCRHFIISNSSYSWWAQFLCPHSEKRVYAPAVWYRDGTPVDLYDDHWHLIRTPLPPL